MPLRILFSVASLIVVACSSSSMPDAGGTDAGGDAIVAVDAGTDATPPDAGSVDGGADLGPPPAGDTCADPRDALALGTLVGDALTVSGTNVAARTDLATCTPFDPVVRNAEVVYRYDVASTGSLVWSLHATTPTRFVVDVRTTCDDAASNVTCEDCSIDCSDALRVTGGTTLYFVVAGVRTTGTPDAMGAFDLTFRLLPDVGEGGACVPSPTRDDAVCATGLTCVEDATSANTCRADTCGDGFLPYGGLDCDDGNTADGDGCSSTCEPMDEGAGGADCASAVTLGFPRVRWLSSESIYLAGAGGDVVAGSDLAPGCATGAGPEAVYVVDLPVRASLDVSATGVDDVSVRPADGACGMPELGCTAGSATASSVDLSLPDLAPGRYLVLLDRESPSTATTSAYTLLLMATPL